MAVQIRLIPNARKTEYVGVLGDALKFKICTPPVDGKANAELIRFLSKSTGISKSKISIVSGEHSKNKTVQVGDLNFAELQKVFEGEK